MRETLQATTWAFHDDDARYYAKGQVNGFVCFSTMMRLLVDDSIQKQDVCMMGLVIVFLHFLVGQHVGRHYIVPQRARGWSWFQWTGACLPVEVPRLNSWKSGALFLLLPIRCFICCRQGLG